ncbi:hypothetical protein RU96_GL000867 [Enterococcus canintestini]|uniref:Uncharacterized protein n=1 Tax=Enterococcus canintestini TaxID=317010 RepID=A0A1L8R3U0_9ENTE|nr:hypothetical protein RU96_GL000867 [Enterococcus canintestini]
MVKKTLPTNKKKGSKKRKQPQTSFFLIMQPPHLKSIVKNIPTAVEALRTVSEKTKKNLFFV